MFITGIERSPRPLTLKQWKEKFKPGMQLRCVYRWYWPDKMPPSGVEICTVANVKTTQMVYGSDRPDLKPGTPIYMDFPRASELKATESGFEIYFPVDPKLRDPRNGPDRSGKLMSRYEYIR